ncbi:UDP-N-acetylmuramyl pentapeptide synthase [Paenibacillus popilliae ATCC 14706]|uniref:UDP-N-acetylmuramyl pentapeptide synthase n=1 Tax=Paenibacillus popilliae ATCC 14706 TaxID=1212764 RepID=M9LH85_PAEPP|nr:UDP-N-acetylmuramyl pentapeptide synthase [Paenibacillus popilliae ATCC 14706]
MNRIDIMRYTGVDGLRIAIRRDELQDCWLGFFLMGHPPTSINDLARPHYTKILIDPIPNEKSLHGL